MPKPDHYEGPHYQIKVGAKKRKKRAKALRKVQSASRKGNR